MKTFTLIFAIAIAFIARCHAMNAMKVFRTNLTANNIYLWVFIISHISWHEFGFFFQILIFSFLFSVSMEFSCFFFIHLFVIFLGPSCFCMCNVFDWLTARSLTKSAKSWNGRLSCRGGTSSNHIDKPSKHATSNRISFTKQVQYARFILESIVIY